MGTPLGGGLDLGLAVSECGKELRADEPEVQGGGRER